MSEDFPSSSSGQHVYPHHTSDEVSAAAVALDLAQYPDAYHSGLDPYLEAKGITVNRSLEVSGSKTSLIESVANGTTESEPISVLIGRLNSARDTYIQSMAADTQLSADERWDARMNFHQELRRFVSDPDDEIEQIFRDSDLTLPKLGYLLSAAEDALQTCEIYDSEMAKYMYGDTLTATALINLIPKDTLRATYASPLEAGITLRNLIAQEWIQDFNDSKFAAARQLADIYQTDVIGLRRLRETAVDPQLRAIVTSPFMAGLAIKDMSRVPGEGQSLEQFTLESWRQASEILKAAGLPEHIVYEYQRVIEERSMLKDDNGLSRSGHERGVDGLELKIALLQTIMAAESLGPDALVRLHDECGITNFDNYSSRQLSRMIDYLDGKPETLANLAMGDVTVVLTDGRGDHNGAFGIEANLYDNDSQRTLFFEINRPTDLYRHIAKLRAAGIKPSTIVLAAHGSPGMMSFGEQTDPSGFTVTNLDQRAIDQAYDKYRETVGAELEVTQLQSLQSAKGLKRLVEDYMQDGKGIDGPADSIGRRRILLDSCSQAVQREIMRQTWWRRKKVQQSTAETITLIAENPKLDVFAPLASVVIRPTEQGVRFMQVTEGTENAEAVPAIRHQLNAKGRLIVSEDEEIKLRRAV